MQLVVEAFQVQRLCGCAVQFVAAGIDAQGGGTSQSATRGGGRVSRQAVGSGVTGRTWSNPSGQAKIYGAGLTCTADSLQH